MIVITALPECPGCGKKIEIWISLTEGCFGGKHLTTTFVCPNAECPELKVDPEYAKQLRGDKHSYVGKHGGSYVA